MEVETNLPPRAPKEQPSVEQQFAALLRVAQSTAEGPGTGSGGSSAASSSRAARGGIASAASTSADSSRGTHHFHAQPT